MNQKAKSFSKIFTFVFLFLFSETAFSDYKRRGKVNNTEERPLPSAKMSKQGQGIRREAKTNKGARDLSSISVKAGKFSPKNTLGPSRRSVTLATGNGTKYF
jgi:hypothetical protein